MLRHMRGNICASCRIKKGKTMKYFVLIPDGMADRPSDRLSGMTPMQVADKPTMDRLASRSLCGTVLNVPDGMVP